MEFMSLNLSNEVLSGVDKAGFVKCTEVQERVLPTSLKGRDVMVQSKTGSGKTAVFLLTVLERFIESERKSKALIIAPTRELAVQIEEDAKLLSSGIDGYNVGCFYGGVGYKEQDDELKKGVDLYVGTPGRLIDYAKNHKIDFRQFDIIVLDEADRMFDMGFYPDIQYMFSIMRAATERQTMLFSATLSTKVRNLAWKYMNEPEEIEVQPEEITVKNITQELFHVTKDEKFPLLLSILAKIKPESSLIFTNTKDKAVEVSKRLNINGYKSEYLMGDMAQGKRLQTLDKMKNGKLQILVATDVAARGLQIDDLQLVVNYDIPEDYENYVHRIGRTARAGKSGKAITLACEEYIYGLEAIESYIQMKIPVLWADECGLVPVEDKSKGFVYRANKNYSGNKKDSRRRGKDFAPKKGSTKSGKKPLEKKQYSEDKPLKKDEIDKLSAMSLDERMAYYKKAYGGANISQKKPVQKKPVQKKPANVQTAQKTSTEAPKTPMQAPKKGIVARIKAFLSRRGK